MNLSFREQAVIQIAHGLIVTRDKDGNAVLGAQALAEDCCEAWGHDWLTSDKNLFRCDESGKGWNVIWQECQRCGSEREQPEDWGQSKELPKEEK